MTFSCLYVLKIQLASEFVQNSKRLLCAHDVPTVDISTRDVKSSQRKSLPWSIGEESN